MTIKQIDAALEEGESFKQIAQAYSEIANLKIKRIRANVERNRAFFTEISKVYNIIRKFAINKKVNITKNKKRVSLVLTSNHGFYGKSNADLLKFFVETTQTLDTDRIILGQSGIDYLKNQPAFSSHKEVLLKEDQPSAAELTYLTNLLKEYNQALIFYPTLKSLLVQSPAVTDITATTSYDETAEDKSFNFKFIFEPELAKILQFFDSQVTTLLLEETFLESELARTASRFIAMDSAETEANKLIKDYETQKAFIKRGLDNNAILENFATMVAVRKTLQ